MQNTYILLRDNKESNSLTLKDLEQIGLEETDLIWVECQSMDWRSPREIPELKILLSTGGHTPKISKIDKTGRPETPNEDILVSPKANGAQIEDAGRKEWNKSSREKTAAGLGLAGGEMVSQTKSSSPPAIPPIAKDKYQKLNRQVDNGYRLNFSIVQVKRWALYAGLVIAGAIIMFLVLNLRSNKPGIVPQGNNVPEKDSPAVSGAIAQGNTIPSNPPEKMEDSKLASQEITGSLKKVRKKAVAVSMNNPDSVSENMDSLNLVPSDTSRNTKPILAIKVNPVTIEEISSKISVSANNYSVGLLGGIRNLSLTLQNNSGYMLDKVSVQVDYLNSSGNIVNKSEVTFRSVKPGGSPEMQVNKSSRGVKVTFHVTHIDCKALESH